MPEGGRVGARFQRRLVILPAALLAAAPLFGQAGRDALVRPKTYGTVQPTGVSVLASEFAPPDSSVGWSFHDAAGATSRYQTTASPGRWWAPLRVPDGARVESLNFEACDFTPTGQIIFGLRRTILGTGEDIPPVQGTGLAAAPGCLYYYLPFDNPVIIDNSNYDYWLFVEWEGDFSSNNRLQGVHAYYYLQVSPDPPVRHVRRRAHHASLPSVHRGAG